MKVIRIADPDQVRPLHVVLACLVVVVLAGNCLLTSGGQREVLHDGAVDWSPNSSLRAVVELLNLGFTQTTSKGVEIKSLVFGVGSALAMMALAVALGIRPSAGEQAPIDDAGAGYSPDETGEDEQLDPAELAVPGGAIGGVRHKAHISPLMAAQFMMLTFGLWSLASFLWSNAPDFALAGGILLAIQLMWAFAIGLGLNRIAARSCAYALLVVCVVTALLALWYHDERNPTLRASYPVGNPLFLAACLIPGILIGVGVAIGCIQTCVRRWGAKYLIGILAALVAIAVLLWTFKLTGARGPAVGLLAGAGGMALFALRGRGRKIAGTIMVVVLVVALLYVYSQRESFSATGRSATIRLRLFAWSYGFDLGAEAPVLGRGQGGFVLAGDASAAGDDVLSDPLALEARVAHAHNEWLETWCDLGSIGLVVVLAALGLTFWAGARAVKRMPTPSLRWSLIALLSSLLGLVVEEGVGVGLRLPGVPAVYFTVIGLIWALSATGRPRWIEVLQASAWRRLPAFIVPAGLGVAALVASVLDFRAARAFHDVPERLAQLEFDQALELADSARRHQLAPQARLDATHRLCATYLGIARSLQVDALRLVEEAAAADPPDERRLARAQESETRALGYVRAGFSELSELLKKSPSSWGSGILEQGFYVVLAEFDRAAGRPEKVQANLNAAAEALKRELRRRPFDPGLALMFVGVAGPGTEIGSLFEVFARPLRHMQIPPQYFDFLREVLGSPEFAEAFTTVHGVAQAVSADQVVEQWAEPWAPEILRLAAVIWFMQGQFAQSEAELEQAAELYDVLYASAPMGAASCYAELADSRFYGNPASPGGAIEAARKAVELAPDSESGRHIAAAVRSRMATYQLAAGEEESARQLLGSLVEEVAPAVLDAEIGRRYSMLAHSASQGDSPPRSVATWVERALVLNAEHEMGWEAGESVRVLSLALQMGADMRIVAAFVDRVLAERPDSVPHQALRDELRAAMGPTTQPAATQPAATQPAAMPEAGEGPASRPAGPETSPSR
ncbi:MAG TPA: O-antigen ligase family protein [Phycisphaerae bacterium]|nr:O-antigen ligase family protein [Phycisphaerae bacterium]